MYRRHHESSRARRGDNESTRRGDNERADTRRGRERRGDNERERRGDNERADTRRGREDPRDDILRDTAERDTAERAPRLSLQFDGGTGYPRGELNLENGTLQRARYQSPEGRHYLTYDRETDRTVSPTATHIEFTAGNSARRTAFGVQGDRYGSKVSFQREILGRPTELKYTKDFRSRGPDQKTLSFSRGEHNYTLYNSDGLRQALRGVNPGPTDRERAQARRARREARRAEREARRAEQEAHEVEQSEPEN